MQFETKIVAPNVLQEVKVLAANPSSGVISGFENVIFFTEDN